MVSSRHHSHDAKSIKERLSKGPDQSFLRDWIYGGIDGAVTTFAVVGGVAGANLSTTVVLIIGAANILADGFSMAAGNFLGTKSDNDHFKSLEDHEREQIENNPEGEKEEVRQILMMKGFDGDALESAIEVYTRDKDKWVELMMAEEYGMSHHLRSPFKAGLHTFLSFALCGLVPLSPYLMGLDQAFLISCILTAVVFILIGSLKSKYSPHSWVRSGAETLLIGCLAASIAYAVGALLEPLFS